MGQKVKKIKNSLKSLNFIFFGLLRSTLTFKLQTAFRICLAPSKPLDFALYTMQRGWSTEKLQLGTGYYHVFQVKKNIDFF